MKYKIHQINQKETDTLLRKFIDRTQVVLCQHFLEAFQDEKARKEGGEQFWALPLHERSYHVVSINEEDVLLAGINKHHEISSIGKITKEEKFKGKGYWCVKKLIEDVLVDKNKSANKPVFYVNTWASEGGINLFERMTEDLPRGISKIIRIQNGFALYLF